MCARKQWCERESFEYEQIRFLVQCECCLCQEQPDVQWSRIQISVSFNKNVAGLKIKWLHCSGKKTRGDTLKICSINLEFNHQCLMTHFFVISSSCFCFQAPRSVALDRLIEQMLCFVSLYHISFCATQRRHGKWEHASKEKQRAKKWL